VPRPDFVARHRRLAERGWMVAGNRVLLSASFTREALEGRLPIHAWTAAQWHEARGRGAINRTLPLRTLPLGPLRKLGRRRWQRVRTCNLGLWADDFRAVNGFGNGEWSEYIYVVSADVPPATSMFNASTSSSTQGAVDLSIQVPVDNYSAILSYDIEYDQDGSFSTPTSVNFTDQEPTSGNTFYKTISGLSLIYTLT
jgi:hypothetical protein